ncbi:hypothetical protein ACFB49_01720 [Sphingomonas sp. DBB INV C78]
MGESKIVSAAVTVVGPAAKPDRGDTKLTSKTLKCALILIACLGAAACNTVEGMGRDVESVGRTVSDAAK